MYWFGDGRVELLWRCCKPRKWRECGRGVGGGRFFRADLFKFWVKDVEQQKEVEDEVAYCGTGGCGEGGRVSLRL